MTVVIAIILSLFSLVFFPYGYYMERAYTERSTDTVAQEWILAHKEIRNGKIFTGTTSANTILLFKKGANTIEKYFLSGNTLPTEYSSQNPNIRKDTPITLDSRLEIQGISGIDMGDSAILGYYIEAPYASGAFFTGTTLFSSTGVFLTIGYTGATVWNGRARNILLRPYF